MISLLLKIGIGEAHIWKFKEQEIGLEDFFLLTKDDLLELDLPIAARNRVIAIQKYLANEGLHNTQGTAAANEGMTQADLTDFDI